MTDHPALDMLATIDADLLRLERSRASLPARVALGELSAKAAEHAAVLSAIDAEMGPLAASLAELEAEVGKVAERRSVVEARLASSTGASRDLVAMDAERQHLAERQGTLEDQELSLMEQVEPRRIEVLGLIAPIEASAAERREELRAQEAALDDDIAQRTAERATAAAQVGDGLLRRYESISRSVGGVGAARLVDGRCGGCHLALAAAELEAVKKLDPDAVGACEQCGRILIRPGQFAE